MKLLLVIFIAVTMASPGVGYAQLSKGEGMMATIPGKTFKCYVPKYFVVQAQPPGIMHKESGTFVIALKVPAEKRSSVKEGLSREFFEDPRYKILSLHEEDSSIYRLSEKGKLYTLRYTIRDFEFERKTLLVNIGSEQYLIMANYSVKFRKFVRDEVDKVMANFIIR
jgi:hypothetical protein